jgi:hypothetical protein
MVTDGNEHCSKNLIDIRRQQIYEDLLAKSNNNGILKRNIIHIVVEQFNVSKKTVRRIWQRVLQCH